MKRLTGVTSNHDSKHHGFITIVKGSASSFLVLTLKKRQQLFYIIILLTTVAQWKINQTENIDNVICKQKQSTPVKSEIFYLSHSEEIYNLQW